MFYEKKVYLAFARFTGKHRCWSLFYNDVAERDPDTCFWWNFKICKIFFEGRLQPSGSGFQKRYLPEHLKELDSEFIEAVTRDVLWKKVLLEISQNSQENTCVRVSFLIKLQACESSKLFNNTFFMEHFCVTASVLLNTITSVERAWGIERSVTWNELRNSEVFQAFLASVFYPVGIYLFKLTIETIEKGVKYVQS